MRKCAPSQGSPKGKVTVAGLGNAEEMRAGCYEGDGCTRRASRHTR